VSQIKARLLHSLRSSHLRCLRRGLVDDRGGLLDGRASPVLVGDDGHGGTVGVLGIKWLRQQTASGVTNTG